MAHRGTHLQHLDEEEQGFLVLCSTKETKNTIVIHNMQYRSQEAGAPKDNTLQEALGVACGGNNTAEL